MGSAGAAAAAACTRVRVVGTSPSVALACRQAELRAAASDVARDACGREEVWRVEVASQKESGEEKIVKAKNAAWIRGLKP